MNRATSASAAELFDQMLAAQQTAYECTERFLASADRMDAIRQALHEAGPRRITAQALLRRLGQDELLAILPDLVWLASWTHGGVLSARQAILSLPRDVLVSQIESLTKPLLSQGGDDEYRRILELYMEIDPGMTFRLAQRAAADPDPDIAEAGAEFLAKLSPANGQPEPAATETARATN